MIANHKDTEARRSRLNDLSHRVIGLAIEVHRELGPGLLESIYEEAFACEMSQQGVAFERQRELPVFYKGTPLPCAYRLDFVVEQSLIVELKAVQEILPVHMAQVLTYLKLERLPLGLLINFNVAVLKDGIRRVVCGDVFKD